MIKFTSQDKLNAAFNGSAFSLTAPEDWDSIGDGPTREAVKAWIAAGNVPEPADLPDPKIAIQAQIAALESSTMLPRVTREFMLVYMESQATPAQLAGLPAYVKVKALDTEIAALRSQLA